MKRDYVLSIVNEKALKYEAYLTKVEKSNLIDSILFDWNEIGDREADFEALVDWNVEQFLMHSESDSGLRRVELDEVRNFIPYPKEWFDISYKPKPKYFMLRKEKNGWDKVYYFLDAKTNQKKYSNKLLE